jgi:hypothetical protein
MVIDSSGRRCQSGGLQAFVRDAEEVRCLEGFFSDNGKCIDVNECKLEMDECTENQACLNTKGSYLCIPLSCPKDFEYREDIGYFSKLLLDNLF